MLPWLIAVAALAVACVAYGILIERRWYRLVRRRIPILPTDGAPELTMLHLSDLHLTRRSRTMRGFLSGLPRCDVCVVTGDIVGEPEADAKHGKISITSPLARALIGKAKGASVEVVTPGGAKAYELKKVEWR